MQKTSQLPSNPRAEQRAALCDEGPVKDVWAAGAARDAAVRWFWVAASLVGTGAGNVSGVISGERLRLYHSPPPTPR